MLFIEDGEFASGAGRDARHGFFGRRGGASSGLFSSLNCGPGSGDDLAAVAENRARAARALSRTPDDLLTLHQIHSDICLTVEGPWPDGQRPQADALVTDRPGLLLGVLTADCAPVLFFGRRGDGAPVAGAAHAGWAGALKGVLENTVEAMEALGAAPGRIQAAIGPCIGQESYEVKEEFSVPFIAQDPANSVFFVPGAAPGRLMFDLPAYCAYRLALLGVPLVSTAGIDTCAGEGDYFSFRRSTLRAEGGYGRQLSAITISGG